MHTRRSTSTRSSNNSVLSRGVLITTNVQPANGGIQIIDGGLSDEDETMGAEREAAVASPVKGKGRATSAVSNILSSEHSCLTNILLGRCEGICRFASNKVDEKARQ
jgi:hypothetical protein